ncbi:MAG: UbiA prenyltransferase family protein, partial [Thermoplasmata archaeon]|nr:UbiA prenyltransferase family protein [Thermoplasmata archaeon]
MRTRPTDLLRLFRIHTGAATAAVPALGFLVTGGSYPGLLLVALAALCHHAWGFSLNEVMDLEVDKRAKDLSHKPLVSGRISSKGGLYLSTSMGIVSFLLLMGAAYVEGNDPGIPLGLLLISTVSGIVYNVFGKKFPLSDIFVGGWIFFMVL